MNSEESIFSVFTLVLMILMIIVWGTPFYIVLINNNTVGEVYLHEFTSSLLLSIVTSLISTIIVLILALPACYHISRFIKGYSRKIVLALLMTPIMISPSAIGSTILLFLARNPIGRILNDSFSLVNDPKGIVVAQTAIGLPIAISYFTAVFTSISGEYEEIALVYGLNRAEYFVKILLPMMRRQVFLGSILVFARVFADFGASFIVGGGVKGRTWTLPVFIYMITQQGEFILLSITIAIYFVTAFVIYLLLFSAEK